MSTPIDALQCEMSAIVELSTVAVWEFFLCYVINVQETLDMYVHVVFVLCTS